MSQPLTKGQIQHAKIAAWALGIVGGLLVALPLATGAPWALFLVGAPILCGLVWAWSAKCPSCHLWAARKAEGSTLIGSQTARRDIVRIDITRDVKGREVSRTRRVEEVTVNVEDWRHVYRCRYCTSRWSVVQRHESR